MRVSHIIIVLGLKYGPWAKAARHSPEDHSVYPQAAGVNKHVYITDLGAKRQ